MVLGPQSSMLGYSSDRSRAASRPFFSVTRIYKGSPTFKNNNSFKSGPNQQNFVSVASLVDISISGLVYSGVQEWNQVVSSAGLSQWHQTTSAGKTSV
jgi:hypothetical protein